MPPLVIRTHSAGGDFGPLRAEFSLPESFGPEVLVIAPPELREQVLQRLEAVVVAHGGTDVEESHG